MSPKPQRSLEERVITAAEAALADHQYVSALDILLGIGFLASSHVEAWRKSQVPYLERVVQANLSKVSRVMAILRGWALQRGLQPSETAYLARTRGAREELQFSKSGDAGIERAYRTHYVSPELSARKKERIREKLEKPPDLVVFDIARESTCSQCRTELASGSFLFMEKGQPLCLGCADMDHLVYLPSGDAALTRRAKQRSGRIGRSAAGRELDPDAVRLAVIAAVRHRHTDYDELLMRGIDRSSAREGVAEEIERILQEWEEP